MSVELIDCMGSDLSVVNAARVSFGKQREELSDADIRLLRYLAREGHWSPFAHATLSFRVTAPIFVARQLAKHQVGLCVSGDTEISFVKLVKGVSNGVRRVKIADLYKMWIGQSSSYNGKFQCTRGHLRVLNTDTRRFETGHIIDIQCNGIKEVFEITTSSGKSVKLTRDHLIYTTNGWMPLDEAIGLGMSSNNIATLSKKCFVGLNGVPIAGNGLYRDPSWLKEQKESGFGLQEIADASHFEEIMSVRYAGEEEVFDLTTDHPHHNFVGNNFVLHNCWNEISRRYVDDPPDFYAPGIGDWRHRPADSIKQGSGERLSEDAAKMAHTAYHIALNVADDSYRALLKLGVAPEQARAVLPLATLTTWIWTGSLYAFARVCHLRLDAHAQAETAEVAGAIDELARRHFPHAWAALMAGSTGAS